MGVQDFSDDLRALRRRLTEAAGYLDLEGSERRLAELEVELARPDLWDDTDVGQRVTREYGHVKADVDEMAGLDSRLSDAETLYELAVEEDDASPEAELSAAVDGLGRHLDRLALQAAISGEHRARHAV